MSHSAAPRARFGLAPYKLVPLHTWAEGTTEAVLYVMAVFAPWLFGCAQSTALTGWEIFGCRQPWTIWTMNFCGYALGGLLLVKWLVRAGGYRPPRWDDNSSTAGRWTTRVLGAATWLILLYTLVSVVNFRGQFIPADYQFKYNDRALLWLPHSYELTGSWRFFLNHLALAAAFWAARDWLLGKTLRETRGGDAARVAFLPARLKRLLWVLSVNGALLALEGIAQRVSGTDKLLWYIQPRINKTAEGQFGPFAYRSNAAQYFNLLWPAALALWWTLRREAQFTAPALRSLRHHWLLGCVALMAACPLFSYSRGGAMVGLATISLAALVLATALRQAHGATKFGLFLFFVTILVLGFAFGWDKLGDRMQDLEKGVTGRAGYNEMAWPMVRDYPVFGSGPGTFGMLFQLYQTRWDIRAAQLHNDWLETFITFGPAGCALIALAAGAVFGRRFGAGGIHASWRFTLLLWVALAGCLAHALFDFPLQMYSVLWLFLLLCSILSVLGERPAAAETAE